MIRLAEKMERDDDVKKERKQRSVWPKVLDLILRCWHIGTSSMLFGGIVWAVPFARLSGWHNLSIASGCAMIILNIFRSRHWPYQGRGAVAALHICLLWLVHIRQDLMVPLVVTVLIVGVAGSHMPGNLRHWSFVHGWRID